MSAPISATMLAADCSCIPGKLSNSWTAGCNAGDVMPDLLIQFEQSLFQEGKVLQAIPNHAPMMFAHPMSFHSSSHFRNPACCLASWQLGNLARTGFPSSNASSISCPETPKRSERTLDVCVFEHFLDSVALNGGIVQQLPTAPCQVAHFSHAAG